MKTLLPFSFSLSLPRLLFVLALSFSLRAAAAEEIPPELAGVGIDPPLGAQVPLDLTLVGESGEPRPLSGSFDGKRPVLLVLSYYGCPMLCGLVLNAVRESLARLEWLPGEHYRIVTVSIDPQEGPDLAAAKKKSVLEASPPPFRSAAAKGWDFLVGKDGSEKRLASAVGFRYKWDPTEKQWAHGAAIFLLSPTGRLTRVLFGLDFPTRDLKLALLEAGEGKIGTIAEKLLLFCYHYDPKGNKYAVMASRLVSLGGALTVTVLLLAWLLWFVRLRRKGKTCPVSR